MSEEIEVYTVAVGKIPRLPVMPKGTKEAINLIKSQEGFLGFSEVPLRGTLCLFRTENDAKRARNVMLDKGITVGDNICKVFIDKQYVS